MMMMARAAKWTKGFMIDLTERVGSTAVQGMITLVTMDNILDKPGLDVLWPILFMPTALTFLKGVLANMAQPNSGASAVPYDAGGPRV